MSLVNYSIFNLVDVIENSCTPNALVTDPSINIGTLWINTSTSHINRATVDLENQIISSSFVPIFTALEGTPNTYTNQLSTYIANGPWVFVWCAFTCLSNATQVASVKVSLPFSSPVFGPTQNYVILSNFITDATGAPTGTTLMQNSFANNSNTQIGISSSATIASGLSRRFTLMYSYQLSVI